MDGKSERKKKEEFFKEAFNLNYQKIVSFLFHYVRDKADAENIAQDTFTSFWENLDTVDKNVSPLPYLYMTARNKAFNMIRREMVINKYSSYVKQRDLDLSYKALSSITNEVDANIIMARITKSLSQMNPNTAETFLLSRFNGLKNAEVAEKQKVSIKTVEYRLMSALRVLRENLKEFMLIAILLRLI